MVAAVADEISNTMRNLQLANNSQNLRNNIPVENPGNLNRSNASRVDSNQGSSIRLPSGDPLTQAVYRPDKVSSVFSNWNEKFTYK